MAAYKAEGKPDVPRTAWTVRELAASMHCDEDQVYAWIREGRLRVMPVGRTYRISEEERVRFFAELSAPAVAEDVA